MMHPFFPSTNYKSYNILTYFITGLQNTKSNVYSILVSPIAASYRDAPGISQPLLGPLISGISFLSLSTLVVADTLI